MFRSRNLVPLVSFAAFTAAALAAPAAFGHFELQAPAVMSTQDTFGNPQKNPPCGPNGAGTPTGMVTTYEEGQMITITIKETITHPGHYRVQLAQDMASLPDQPPVTPAPGDECDSVAIDATPQMPLLIDGALAHTAAFAGPQSFQVQLPAGFTCNDCVLQIVEYMSSHGAPCYYYHCAVVDIVAPGSAPDAGPGPGAPDAGGGGGDDGADDSSADGSDDGAVDGNACGCRTGGQGEAPRGAVALLAFVGLGIVVRSRSSRSR